MERGGAGEGGQQEGGSLAPATCTWPDAILLPCLTVFFVHKLDLTIWALLDRLTGGKEEGTLSKALDAFGRRIRGQDSRRV